MKVYAVVKVDGTFAGVPCLSDEEARELALQHQGACICELVAVDDHQVWKQKKTLREICENA